MERPDNLDDHESSRKTEKAFRDLNEFALSTFAATLLRFGIRLLKNIVFTRLLGPAERGVFGLLTTLPDLIVSFGNAGFGLGSTYLVAKKHCDLRVIAGNTILFTVLLGACLIGAGYVVFSFEGLLKGDSMLMSLFAPLIIAMIPFVLLENFSTDLLIATKQIHFTNMLRLLLSGLPVVLIIILWAITGQTLSSALYAWAATIVVIGIWSMARILSKSGFSIGFSLTYLKESLSYGLRGFISILSNAVTRRIDFLFVASMAGAEALGYYTVAVSVAEILLAVPDAFGRPFLPIHFSLKERDARLFAPVVIRHVLFLMVIVCIGAALAGKLVILVLFGTAFLPAYTSMLLLIPGVLALSLYRFLKVDLYSRNLPGLVSWNAALAMACNLALNFVLIPRYGIEGAALSSSVSYGLSTIILLNHFKRVSATPYRDLLIVTGADIDALLKRLAGRRS